MLYLFRKGERGRAFCKKDPWLVASFAAHKQLDSATVKVDIKQGLELENFASSGDFKRTLGQQNRNLFHLSTLLGFGNLP